VALTERRFRVLLAVAAVVGFAIGATDVLLAAPRKVPFGDAFYFHYQAQLLVDGHGWFVDPFRSYFQVRSVPSASHAPLWTLVLALADVLGIRSYFAQLFVACAVDAAAVYVTGMAAREAAGRRAGLVAASLAAVYPGFWINPATGLSESLLLLLVAAVVWAALRYRRSPGWRRACLLGALCALAALDRSEQILLVPFVLLPVLLYERRTARRVRLTHLGAGLVVGAAVLAPWVGFNMSRMQPPEYLSSELGSTLAGANCAQTYSGPMLGSWSNACAVAALGKGGESQEDLHERAVALGWMGAHAGRLPVVIGARIGRQLAVFRPFGQVAIDRLEGRPIWPARSGVVAFWVLVALAVFGAATRLRRRTTLVPFTGITAAVIVVAAATYGSTRLRAPLEVVVVVLGATALDSAVAAWRRRSSPRAEG
jgi:4-amino-4-deoxy-L-arabinose transferase-like glycosyltransferase